MARLRDTGAGSGSVTLPTASQLKALAEIDADLAAPRRMLRLLQGDVGSGKTLVARAGHAARGRSRRAGGADGADRGAGQAASPHAVAAVPGAGGAADRLGEGPGARAESLRGLADGSIPLVVGTHALFQESVEYRDLALAVIDEQHRFGVTQRLLLGGKGEQTDVLVMTATPIPRTLLLTQWGEMDVSRLTEKPRRPAADPHDAALAGHASPTCWTRWRASWTRARRSTGCARWWPRARRSTSPPPRRGSRVLRERFGDVVGLAHGQQESERARGGAGGVSPPGRIRLLVATTVVEVGVDVPAASVMVIEHAERFGLAQLHQLRGRVGRGADGELLPAAAR